MCKLQACIDSLGDIGWSVFEDLDDGEKLVEPIPRFLSEFVNFNFF